MRPAQPAQEARLLVVEDDVALAQLIERFFTRAGFDVEVVHSGTEALEMCRERPPEMVILDLNLPDMNGTRVCRALRTYYTGWILILTASSSDHDQIFCFEIGADDFVTKPVEPWVLLARVNTLLKRHRKADAADATGDGDWVFGTLRIQSQARTATLNRRPIQLTTHEFDLLQLLASHAGHILSRDDIHRALRGYGYDGSDRAIDVKISRLRKKLGDDATDPQRIKTVWGKGYLFVPSAWNA